MLLICRYALGLALLLPWAPAALAEEPFFPFSVWYSGGKARAPMLEPVDATSRERWRKDLEQIRALGFNTVRTWVEWTAGERRPGRYNFENLKLLASLAREAGLKFMVQVYVDSAPDWVGERFPDARFVAQSGEVIPSQAAPGFCFDHAGVREKILAFYAEAARVASEYPNFHGWDLWSEPHIINWAIIDFVPNASFCYCPHTQRRFRRWLRDKYGDLEALNRSWYRTFSKWEQVEAPRFGTILSYTDFIDWRLFIQHKLARDLALRAEAVRAVDPDKVVTSHAAVPSLFTSPLWGVGAPDDWLMVESVDYWGTSVYPKHSFPDRHWPLRRLSVIADFVRSSGRSRNGFYVGELQAGMGIRGTVVGDPVTAEDQALWAWSMLSRGARAINVYAYYPMSSGYEAGGYGLINLDGTLTPRARRLGELARIVTANPELFVDAVPAPAQVAAVYNPLSYLVGGEQHLSPSGAVRDSLIGIYQAFWRRNIPIDFVHLREVEAGKLEPYRLLFLPYPLMLTARAAQALGDYVRSGGTLLAEARLGWNDDRGHAQDVIPGFGLDRVFGVREGRLKMSEEVSLFYESSEAVLKGRGIQEELEPYEGTQVLARFEDGRAAITQAAHGRGRAIAVGSFLAMANARQRNEATESFFLEAAGRSGVEPALRVTTVPAGEFVELRLLDSGPYRLLFLFNHGAHRVTARLPLESGLDLLGGQSVSLHEVVMEPGQIRVFRAGRSGD